MAANAIGGGPELPSQVRNWALICHLCALAVFSGAPFGNILGPLIVYLIKKDEDPFIEQAGRESLNFQITMSIAGILLFGVYIGLFIDAAFWHDRAPIAALCVLPLLFALFVFDFVNVIVAMVRTSQGIRYRYPLTLRFVRSGESAA